MKTIRTQINFGGFYNTLHDDIVERAVAYDLGAEDEYGETDWENEELINYDKWFEAKTQYSKEWITTFNEENDLSIEFVKLDCPREYNFITDVIIVDVSFADCLKLFKIIKDQELTFDVIDNIKESTTSRDGYGAFYNYADFFKSDKRNFLIETLIDTVLNAYNENENETLTVDEFFLNLETEVVA